MFAIARDKVWIEYIMRYGRRSYILLVSAHTVISIWGNYVREECVMSHRCDVHTSTVIRSIMQPQSLKMCHERSLHQGGICYTDTDTVTLTFMFTVTFTFNSLFFFTYWHNLTSLQQQTVRILYLKFGITHYLHIF